MLSKADRNGLYPVYFCITINRKRKYLFTGYRVKEKDWDPVSNQVKKNTQDASFINASLAKKISDLQTRLIQREISGEPPTLLIAKKILSGGSGRDDFFSFCDDLLSTITKTQVPETVAVFKNEVRRIRLFSPVLSFADIDQGFLRRYQAWLMDHEKLSNNSVHKAWKLLRKIFNAARREKPGIDNPFAGFKNPVYKQTDRTYLLKEQVQAMEDLMNKPLRDDQRTTLNYFLLGCYSGLRFSDWERFNYKGYIQGDRILLRAKKNGELISLQMHQKLKEVVERLKDSPPVRSEQETNRLLKGLAVMAGINKPVTCHVSRHSFAVRCAELDIPPSVTAELMGITLKTVMVYYRITNRKIDQEFAKWDG